MWASKSVFKSDQRRRNGQRNRRPFLETLEERSLLAGMTSLPLTHDYRLDGSFADSMSGPDLVPAGGTLSATAYSFAANQGLSLGDAIDSANYSIELHFRFSEVSSYRKIVDFKNLTADSGLYNYNTALDFYPKVNGPDLSFAADTDVQLVLTRDATSKEVVGYLDGMQVISFTDTTDLAEFSEANQIAQFFKDDVIQGTEASAGVVDRIRIYDEPLTASQVMDIYNGILDGLPECEIRTLNQPGAPGTAVIADDADSPGSNTLLVTGTSRSDIIVVEPDSRRQGMLRVVQSNRVLVSLISNDVQRIVIYGEQGNDKITVSAALSQPATIFGGAGNDVIVGGKGADQINGGGDKDVINGGLGNDTLCGGDGKDVVNGGLGEDLLFGEAGNDVLNGENGDDWLLGGDGNDVLAGGAGSDRLYGQANDDELNGGSGNNILVGGDGNDMLTALLGRNILIGGLGLDVICSKRGDDILIAGSTFYDEDDTALQAILDEWASANIYEDRVNSIRNGGGANGLSVLNSTRVIDDGVVDTLASDGGRDWFFVGAGDKAKGRLANEFVDAEGP